MKNLEAVRRLLQKAKRPDRGPLERAAGGEAELAEILASLAEGPDAEHVLPHLGRLAPKRERCFLRPEGLLSLLRARHEVDAKAKAKQPAPATIGLYAGWDAELEELTSALIGAASPGPLEPSFKEVSAPENAAESAAVLLAGASALPEPEASSLAFALARRGRCPSPHPLLGEAAVARIAPSFLALGSMRDECFRGWSKVFSAETFGRAAFARVADVEEISVAAEELTPLVPFASDDDLLCAIQRYHASWSDEPIQRWLLDRAATMKPKLQAMMKRFTRELSKEGSTFLIDAEGHAMSALGQMLSASGETWSKAEAKVVEEELVEQRGALVALDPARREAWLLAPITKEESVDATLLSWFPSPKIAEALFTRIKKRRAGADASLYEALAGQGPDGEAKLVTLLGDPEHAEKALEALPRSEVAARAVMPLIAGSNNWHVQAALRFLRDVPEPARARVLDAQIATLPPAHAISLVAEMAHRPEALRWAESLPSLPETEPARRWVLSRPGTLPALCAEIAEAIARSPEAIEAECARIAKLEVLDACEERVRWVEDDKPSRGVALAVLAGAALDPILPVCKALGPTAELAWGAVWWWARDRHHTASNSSLWAMERAFGAALAAPVAAALDEGRLEGAEVAALDILAEHDAAGSWERLVRYVNDSEAQDHIVSGLITAVNEGVQSAQAWIEGALLGSAAARKVALSVIAKDASARWVPALDRALAGEAAKGGGKQGKKAKALSPAAAREIASARAVAMAQGSACARSDRKLPRTPAMGTTGPLAVAGSVESLAAAGSIRALLGQGELCVAGPWGEHRLDGLSLGCVCLTPEGDRVLLWDGDREIDILGTGSAEELSRAPSELLPDSGLSNVVPLPGGRLLAVCFAQNSTPLSLWSLADGSAKAHPVDTTVADLQVIDEARYALLGDDESLSICAIDTGETLAALRAGSGRDPDGESFTSLALAGARWLLASDGRGALSCWDLADAKPRLVTSFEAMPKGRLVADPESGWAVLVGESELRCFREGQPARTLPAPWKPEDRTKKTNRFPRRCAEFLGPGLLALGGSEGVDAWDLEAGEHLGKVGSGCRAITKVGEKRAWWGDEKGKVWELALG